MDFRILGPLEVMAGPERLELGGGRQHIVMAMLLLSANSVVSVGRLQVAIYGEDLPPTSRSRVQISISSLRRLFASHGHAQTISTRAQGYLLQVGTGLLDSRQFERLAAAARAARDACRARSAPPVRSYRSSAGGSADPSADQSRRRHLRGTNRWGAAECNRLWPWP